MGRVSSAKEKDKIFAEIDTKIAINNTLNEENEMLDLDKEIRKIDNKMKELYGDKDVSVKN